MPEENEKSAEAGAETKAEENEKVEAKAAPAEAASSAAPAAAASSAAPSAPREKNRNLFAVASETMVHINECERDKTIVFRHSDRKSVIFMLSAFALEFALLFLFVLDPAFRPVCIGLAVLADVLFGLAILWYVLLRFGVLRSFERRQTVLTWQLMIGSGALFAFYTMNIAFIFFTYYNAMINSPGPPPL